jgi:tRNA (mo5U34)-methyltransferase
MSHPASATPEVDTRHEERIRALAPWFHHMILRGVQTAPDHFLGDYPAVKWREFKDALPADLRGRTVLDLGCNAGFYAIEMKRRGADRVVAVDVDARYLRQARLAAELSELEIEFRQLSVYDVAQLGEKFDIVLFMGVLYHLRHPLLALDLIHEHVARDLFIFQSMLRGSPIRTPVQADYPITETEIFHEPGFPRLHFLEHHYAGDPTNWWTPNRAGAEAMLRSAGFDILKQPEEEVYFCRWRALPEGTHAVYPASG